MKETDNLRHYAQEVEQLDKKGCCNETAATVNLKCNEVFTEA